MTFRGSLQGDSLHVAVLQLESPLLAAEARGDVDVAARTIRAAYRLAVPDLARVGDAYGWPAAGALEATGRATGDVGSPELAGAVTITDGVFDGRPYGRIGLTHTIRLGDPATGSVEMTVREAWLGDAAASARVRLDPDRWRLEGIRASLPGATLASDVITIAPDTWLVDGSGRVVSPDLGPLAEIADFKASGAAEGAFAFRSQSGRQAMEATVEFAEAEVPGLSLGHAVLDVAVRDLPSGQGLDLRVSAMSGTAGAFAVDNLSVKAAGALAALTFSGEAVGALGTQPVDLNLAGRAALADGPTLITVEAASASVGQEHLALGRPVEVRIDPGGAGVAVGELDLRLAGGGRLGGAGTWRADGLQGHLSGTRVPLTLLGHLVEAPVAAGSLDIEAAFDTRGRSPRAEIEARARDILLTGVGAEQALAAALSGRWDGARLELQAVLRGGFGEPAEARLALPVGVGDDGLPRLFRQDAVDGSLAWRGAMADLWQLLPPSAHVAEGDVDLQVRIAGTVDQPRLSGHAEWSRGRYDHVDAGLALVDVQVAAAMTDTAVITLHGSASDGGEGRVAVDATLRWDERPTIEAGLHVEQAALLQRDDVTARVSGTGRLQGPWSDLVFRGEFAVDEAEIRLTEVTPAAAVELDGVRLAHAAEEAEAVTGRKLALDLTVRADRAVFIRGRGLESEWDLELHATGDVSAPVLSGAVRKIRGRLDLLGKPFELTRGDITFDGAAGAGSRNRRQPGARGARCSRWHLRGRPSVQPARPVRIADGPRARRGPAAAAVRRVAAVALRHPGAPAVARRRPPAWPRPGPPGPAAGSGRRGRPDGVRGDRGGCGRHRGTESRRPGLRRCRTEDRHRAVVDHRRGGGDGERDRRQQDGGRARCKCRHELAPRLLSRMFRGQKHGLCRPSARRYRL